MVNEKTQCDSVFCLLPKDREGAIKEFKKQGKHRWLFIIYDMEYAKSIEKYIKAFRNGRWRYIHINNQKELDAVFGEDILDPKRFIQLSWLDGNQVSMSDTYITVKEGSFLKKINICALYCNITYKEITDYYNNFILIQRGLRKENGK